MRLLIVSVLIVITDQVSKLWIKGIPEIHATGLLPGDKIPIVGNLFSITLVENPGIAFGITFGSEFKLLLSIFTLLASVGLLIFFYKIRNKNFGLKLSVALILGGAVGNLIDRLFYGIIYGYGHIFYGKVVDFFNLNLFNIYLFKGTIGNYVFNVADLSVTAGMIGLLLVIRKKNKEKETAGTGLENLLVKDKE